MRIKKITNYIALTFLTALGGCAFLGPSYSKPDTQDPQKWVSSDSLSAMESTNIPAMAWWKSFNDPVLNNLIESALKNNDNIQAAVGNVIAAKGYLQQIQSAWIPTASGQVGYQTRAVYGEGYNAGLLPSYSLNIFQLIRSYEYAEASYEVQVAAKDAMRLSIISQVVGGYFTLRGNDYLLVLQKQLVKDLGEILTLTKQQYKDGYISLYQLQQYIENYNQALAQIPIIEKNIVASRNTLRVLLNENPGDLERGLEFMQFNSYGVIPANIPSTVLRNRPDVRQSEQQLIAANANIGVATSQFFPTISMNGNAGAASNALNSLFTPGNEFWNYTATATMPLLNFSIYGQIDQAKGQYYNAYYTYLQTVRNAFASVDSDFSAHDQVTKSLDTQIKYYDSTVVAYKLAQQSFKDGLYSLPTLLNNAVTMDNAAITVANSKQTQLNTIVQLYQDLGGGYAYQNYSYESANRFGDQHDVHMLW
jgi:NodT family efflux transporter outer membrane factor (OMF) lipoprotein